MQKIERKHLTLRTRLKRVTRTTLCFARAWVMHDRIIGLDMTQVEFGCAVGKGATPKVEHSRQRDDASFWDTACPRINPRECQYRTPAPRNMSSTFSLLLLFSFAKTVVY